MTFGYHVCVLSHLSIGRFIEAAAPSDLNGGMRHTEFSYQDFVNPLHNLVMVGVAAYLVAITHDKGVC